MQIPTVGRIVLFTSTHEHEVGPQGVNPFYSVHPAIITGLNVDGSVALFVFSRRGAFNVDACTEAASAPGSGGASGRWSWPPRT